MPSTLFPTFQVPKTVAQRQSQVPRLRYGADWQLDFSAGDIMLGPDGRGGQLTVLAAWAQRQIYTVLVERFSTPIYPRSFGIELQRALRQPTAALTQAAVRRAVTEALKADSHTRDVTDFTFSIRGDSLTMSCWIIPTVGSAQQIGPIILRT